ncbi:YcxB family protein [Rhizobium sp. P38BS-XIX]|uniref:YcxB family protein n=1 Tax=Rhizobium sp. P38BS-XIX TaxID=2726740 RepID=UPI0014575F2E|nr:YcxB family protein [Rhizobium sp. P38BS-XIX]NLR99214.1 YcxB family protein [Rhizobium sp. P38BS-XIX]
MSELRQDEQRIDILFQLTPQDLTDALRLHFRQHLRSRPGIVRMVVLWILALLGYGLIVASLIDANDALVAILCFAVVAPLAIVGIPFLIVYTLGGRTARKTYAEQRTLQKPIHLSWNEDGVHLRSDFGEAKMQWTDFVKTRQDRHCLLFYESQRLYRIIPKRILTREHILELQGLALKVRDHRGFE